MGYIRFAFALAIMAAHCTQSQGKLGDLAGVGVMGFYALAGFTSVAALAGYSSPWRFIASRLMRVWPCYALAFSLSLGALWLGWLPHGGMPFIGIPDPFAALLQLVIMVQPEAIAVVPQGWMLSRIMAGYGLVAIGAFATPQRAAAVLAGVLLLARAQVFHPYSLTLALLGFAVGAVAHHLNLRIPRDGFRSAWAGALSYPIFLSHYAIGAAMPQPYGLSLFAASLVPTLVISLLLVILVERPITCYRNRFKKCANQPL